LEKVKSVLEIFLWNLTSRMCRQKDDSDDDDDDDDNDDVEEDVDEK